MKNPLAAEKLLPFLLCAVLPAAAKVKKPEPREMNINISLYYLHQHVNELVSLEKPRAFHHIEYLDSAAYYIEGRLQEFGCEPRRQTYSVEGKKVWNVITHIGEGKGPRIVVGAHYDVCGEQHGADDNGSAVAGLLEIARVLKSGESELKNHVEIAFYTLEEPPFFGQRFMGS
jgi:hypothetical protein